MATQWYYRDAGEERGPVAFRELVELVRSQAITETDLVRSSWHSEWQPAHSVVGLFYMAGRLAEAPTQPDPPPTEPIVSEAPADVAAPDADEATKRPAWLTRLFSIAGGRRDVSRDLPIDATTADGLAGNNANNARPMPTTASSPADQISPKLAEYCPRPASSSAGDAWSSAVEEAVVRADLRAAGLSPAAGRWRRLASRVASPLTTIREMGHSRWIRPAFRILCAIVCANLVAVALEKWSADEDLRFPRRDAAFSRDAGNKYFPLVGQCGTGEYAFLVFDAMLVTGAAGYFAARWIDSRAD
jgi:hypothetical protein